MNIDIDNIEVKKLETENADLKLRLNIINQSLILGSGDLRYLKLLIDGIEKHNKKDK